METQREAEGPVQAVIGIGLNINQLSDAVIGQTGISVSNICQQLVSRNQMAALLLAHLYNLLKEYERDGFASFVNEWNELDSFSGCEVVARHHDGISMQGLSLGVDVQGVLRLQVGDQQRCISSGLYSLRKIKEAYAV